MHLYPLGLGASGPTITTSTPNGGLYNMIEAVLDRLGRRCCCCHLLPRGWRPCGLRRSCAWWASSVRRWAKTIAVREGLPTKEKATHPNATYGRCMGTCGECLIGSRFSDSLTCYLAVGISGKRRVRSAAFHRCAGRVQEATRPQATVLG